MSDSPRNNYVICSSNKNKVENELPQKRRAIDKEKSIILSTLIEEYDNVLDKYIQTKDIKIKNDLAHESRELFSKIVEFSKN